MTYARAWRESKMVVPNRYDESKQSTSSTLLIENIVYFFNKQKIIRIVVGRNLI